MDKNKTITTKQARDLERVSKAVAGEAFFILDLKMATIVLEESESYNNGPWKEFGKNYKISPWSFQKYTIGP